MLCGRSSCAPPSSFDSHKVASRFYLFFPNSPSWVCKFKCSVAHRTLSRKLQNISTGVWRDREFLRNKNKLNKASMWVCKIRSKSPTYRTLIATIRSSHESQFVVFDSARMAKTTHKNLHCKFFHPITTPAGEDYKLLDLSITSICSRRTRAEYKNWNFNIVRAHCILFASARCKMWWSNLRWNFSSN